MSKTIQMLGFHHNSQKLQVTQAKPRGAPPPSPTPIHRTPHLLAEGDKLCHYHYTPWPTLAQTAISPGTPDAGGQVPLPRGCPGDVEQQPALCLLGAGTLAPCHKPS